jgi:pimeloyl-ACP methyl ester carboxylesterase
MTVFILSRATKCADCGSRSGWRRYECQRCAKTPLCAACADHPIITRPDGDETWDHLSVLAACTACKKNASQLDTSVTREVVGSDDAKAGVLFLHGGAGCRLMFLTHAQKLWKEHGIRSVLPDLPGHGSRVSEPTTLDAAVQLVIDEGRAMRALVGADGRLAIVGASLGGYIAMEAMKHPECAALFNAAVVLSSSQTTGVGAGMTARVALFAMAKMIPTGKVMTMKLLLKESQKSKHLNRDDVWTGSFQPGFFFEHGTGHVAILQRSDPVPGVRKFCEDGQHRVLFMLGDQDHHDNKVNLEAAGQGHATTVVCSGGDHFFTHDTRFVDDIIRRIANIVTLPEAQPVV